MGYLTPAFLSRARKQAVLGPIGTGMTHDSGGMAAATERRAVAEGLELRRFQADDAATIFTAVDRDRAHLREWLPWVDATRSVAEIQAFLLRAQAQFDEGLGPNFGIWLDG